MHPHTEIRCHPRAVFRRLTDGSAVVLDLASAAYYGLNPVGSLIWDSLDGGTTFARLMSTLHAQLEDAPPTLEDEVAAFLAELSRRELIEVTGPSTAADRPRP